MSGNADVVRGKVTTFGTHLKARKGKSVTIALLSEYDGVKAAYGSEFPESSYVPYTPSPAPVPDPDPQGYTTYVPAGADLQAAVNAAAPGTTLRLALDGVFGAFSLPVKATDVPVKIQPDTTLPDGRISRTAQLPKLIAAGGHIQTMPGAHDYIIQGLDIPAPPGVTICSLGTASESLVSELAARIVFDRMHIHADPLKGAFRAFAMNGLDWAVLNSVVSGFWHRWSDNQAINAYNGPGIGVVENNYLEASGENVMIGGGTSKVPGTAPSLRSFRRNHCFKPLEWKAITGSVKNLFELKNCRGAVVEENIFENCWTDAQNGSAVLFTVRNQGGENPDATVKDITYRRNIIRNVTGNAINFLGWDDEKATNQSVKGSNAEIADNLFDNCAMGIQVADGWNGLRISHNTFRGILHRLLTFTAKRDANNVPLPTNLVEQLVFANNIAQLGSYGVFGDYGIGMGTVALNAYAAPGWVFEMNGLEKPSNPAVYPVGNAYVPTGTFATHLQADARPVPGGVFDIIGTDGRTIGADISALAALGR